MSFDLIRGLPTDLQVRIFSSYLDKTDLPACSLTCSSWNMIVNHPDLWKEISAKLFTMGILKVTNEKEFIKKHFTQMIKSNDQLVQRVEDFLKKIQLGQTARFRGFFGVGEGHQTVFIEVAPREMSIGRGYALQLSGKLEWEVNQHRFDVEDEYNSSTRILDGALTTPITKSSWVDIGSSFWAHGGTMSAELLNNNLCAYKDMGSYKARLQFPWFSERTCGLHEKIKCLIYVKLEELESERRKSGYAAKSITWIQSASKLLQYFIRLSYPS